MTYIPPSRYLTPTYLPPWSLDLNHIEGAFPKFKSYLQQNDGVLQSVAGTTPLIWEAFAQTTPPACQRYMHPIPATFDDLLPIRSNFRDSTSFIINFFYFTS